MGQVRDDESEEWFDRGENMIESGKYEEAISCFEKAIELKPDHYSAWNQKGAVLCDNLRRYEEAIASFNRAIEIKPDYHAAWHNRGVSLGKLGRYDEEISSFNRAIEINPDFHEAWSNRGVSLLEIGKYEEAIANFDRTIEINPDDHTAWSRRGIVLCMLEQYEEAITNFDRAIEINPNDYQVWLNRSIALNTLGRYEEQITNLDRAIEINPDDYQVWFNRGVTLATLGRYEESVNSYDRVIEIEPDYYTAWSNRGIALYHLGRYEEAITTSARAIDINPDYHEAWLIRGVTLAELGRYEESVNSYDRVIEIEPDHDTAWSNRGVALDMLRRYPESIYSYDKAIEINPGDYKYWSGLGYAIGIRDGSYRAEIEAYQESFTHIHPETHPEGWGFLQHQIGRAYYDEGNNQLLKYRRNPYSYYGQALTSYHNALTTLTRAQFPTLRLETLIDTAKAYLAQNNPSVSRDCQIEANDILGDLLNAEPTFAGKKRLQLEYVSLSQLDVDLFIASGDNIRALETAERDKNNHLIWLLTALDEKIISPKYAQMQQLLTTTSGDRKTGIVYWHLSPDNITTFILHPHQPNPQVLTDSSHQLKNWLKDYDTDNLDTAKLAELGNILQISQINPHLDGIEHLILIPHRDLHRLPLHTYWQNLTTTYLPSIQIGLNLKNKPQPNLAAGFLLVESPDYTKPSKIKNINKSFDLLTNPEIEAAIIADLFQPKTIIPTGEVSKDILSAAFNIPHAYAHFNGHAYHDPQRPQDSSLIVDGDELNCQDLAQIDLTPYHLITLSACETGITTHQNIDTEYVGLVSAFLSRGTNYVVSTLWSVKDLPSSLLMMAFYLYLRNNPAPIALYKAAHWLKNLTHAEEAEFHRKVYQRLLPQKFSGLETINSNLQNAETAAKNYPDEQPYRNPYFWAAFTISGWG
jgi:tetratricopeptide (TPR) repeat protein